MSKWLVLGGGIAVGAVVGWAAALVTHNVAPSAASEPTLRPVPAALKGEDAAVPSPSGSSDTVRLPPEVDSAIAHRALSQPVDAATLERLLEESNSLPKTERQRTQFALYLRYAALHPQAAVDHLLGAERANHMLLSAAFAAWATLDADAALRRADSLDVVQREWASMAVWAVSNAHDDPQRAWQETLANLSGLRRLDALRDIAFHWAETAPAEALAAINALPESLDKKQLQFIALHGWAQEDAEAALRWAQEQPEKDYKVPTLLHFMAEDAPLKAIELAMATDAKHRPGAVKQVIDSWAESDPQAAFEWILSNQSSLADVALAAKPLQHIAGTAPKQALALAERLDNTPRRLAISAILEQWAAHDAPAAAAWLDSSSAELDGNRVAKIAEAYAQQRGEEAFDWVLAQSSEHQRDAITKVMRELAKGAVQRTLQLVQRIDEPALRRSALESVVYAWAREDPRATRRWIATNAEDGQRPALFAQLYMEWAHLDQAEAATNARRHGNRIERDAALRAMTTAVARTNPDLAEELYDEIESPRQRQSAARYLAFWWRETDPKRAERYRDTRD